MTVEELKCILEERGFPTLTVQSNSSLTIGHTEITVTRQGNIEIHEWPPNSPLDGFCLNVTPDQLPSWDEWIGHSARTAPHLAPTGEHT